MHHGSQNSKLEFFPGICFTESAESAAAYGGNVTSVSIDETALRILRVEMSDVELRDAIDNQEWPCDRQRDIDAAVAAGHTAVAYTDCDRKRTTAQLPANFDIRRIRCCCSCCIMLSPASETATTWRTR
jgi:hypothetical protein